MVSHILRILPVPKHAECDTEGERGRLGKPRLEFAIEVLLHVYESPGQPCSKVLHHVVLVEPILHARRRRCTFGSLALTMRIADGRSNPRHFVICNRHSAICN